MNVRRIVWAGLRVIGTASVCVWLIGVIDWSVLQSHVHRFSPGWFVVLLLSHVLFHGLGLTNIAILARSILPEQVPARSLTAYYLMSSALGAITPAQAGELALPYYLKRSGTPFGKGLGIVIVDKTITLAAFLVVGATAAVLYFPSVWTGAGCTLLCLLGVAALIAFGWFRTCSPRGSSSTSFVSVFTSSVRDLASHRGILAINGLLTVVRAATSALTVYVGLAVFGHAHASYADIFMLGSIGRLATYVPVSVNGLGVLEGVSATLFVRAGIPMEATVVALLVNRAVHYAFAAGILAYGLLTGQLVSRQGNGNANAPADQTPEHGEVG